jgi:hypothetical protein
LKGKGSIRLKKTNPKLFKFGIETILELKVKFDYSSLNEEVDFASRLFHFSPWQVLFKQVKHNALDDESDKGNNLDDESTSTNRLTLRQVKNNALDDENDKGNSSNDEPTSTNRLTLTSKLPSLPLSPNYGM